MRRSNLLMALLGLIALMASVWVWAAVDPSAAEPGATDVIAAPADAEAPAATPAFARDAALAERLVREPDERPPADGGDTAPAVDRGDLSALAVLSGRVTRAAGGSPVAGLAVHAQLSSSEIVQELSQRTTDEDGNYRFAVAESCRVIRLTVSSGPDTTQRRLYPDLALRLGETATLDVELTPGATIVGMVVDEQTRPVQDATVWGWTASVTQTDGEFERTDRADRKVGTDSLGRFTVTGIGPEFVLSAEAPGMACLWRLHGRLPDGSRSEGATLQLSAARHAPGRVLGPLERPLGDVVVTAEFVWPRARDELTGIEGIYRTGPAPRTARTDGSGRFLLGPLANTGYEITASHPRYPPWHGSNTPGDTEMLIRLARGATLAGRLLSARGGPVAGGRLRLGSTGEAAFDERAVRTARSDEDGSFELVGLRADAHGLLAVQAGGHAVHVEQPLVIPEDGRQDIEIVLDAERALAGTVVDTDGTPVAGALVHVAGDRIVDFGDVTMTPVPTWESRFAGLDRTTTDEQGHFRIGQLYDGLFGIVVTHPEDENMVAKLFERSGSEDLLVVLDPDARAGVTLAGRVLDALTGLPVESFTITPMIPQGLGGMTGSSSSFHDAAGFFRITALEPGEMMINAGAEGYAPWSLPLTDYAAGEHLLDVQLLAMRTLHLRVVDTGRRPVSAMLGFLDREGREMFVASGMNSGTTVLRTDENGEAVAMRLPADRITVRVKKGFFGGSQDFAFDLRDEPRGVAELVFGGSGEVALIVFVLTGEAPDGLSAEGGALETTLRLLYQALQEGSAQPLGVVAQITARDDHGTVVAERRFDPATPDPEMDIRVPGVPGTIVAKLMVPAEPLELTLAAPGHITERRTWQPDRSGVDEQVVVVFLTPD